MENSNPAISVIIPIYNAETHLEQCLRSLLQQDLQDFEVICVDDGSTDGSGKIIERFKSADCRFKSLSQNNSGAASARNNGFNIAKGKYCLFFDADDFLEPNALSLCFERAEHTNANVVIFNCDLYSNRTGNYNVCNYTIRRRNLPHKAVFSPLEVKQNFFMTFMGWAWDKLFRTDLICQSGLRFQDLRTSNDLYFTFSSLVLAEKLTILDKVLIHHRKDSVGLSTTREKSWHCYHEAIQALKKTLIENNLYRKYERDFLNYFLHFSLWNLSTLAEPSFFLLYKKLHNSWLAETEINFRKKSFYFDKYEYRVARKIIACENCTPALYEKIRKVYLRPRIIKVLHVIRNNGIGYFCRNFINYFGYNCKLLSFTRYNNTLNRSEQK